MFLTSQMNEILEKIYERLRSVEERISCQDTINENLVKLIDELDNDVSDINNELNQIKDTPYSPVDDSDYINKMLNEINYIPRSPRDELHLDLLDIINIRMDENINVLEYKRKKERFLDKWGK